ncbi:hypothetical protein [Mucilaginibacter sp. NFX135]|uniref:hypothetical protein n=1 Tax=Mucilaginibacter sp. NFX135 TaxID=3402687 RepID=UPI003AFA70CA
MENRIGVKITAGNRKVLSVTLNDILSLLKIRSNLKWAILDIYAIGDLGENKSMLAFEEEVGNSENGIIFGWNDLMALSSKLEQIMEIVLIGNEDVSALKRYLSNKEMYNKCKCTIELIDSSYWLIHSTEDKLIKYLKEKLPGGEYVNE